MDAHVSLYPVFGGGTAFRGLVGPCQIGVVAGIAGGRNSVIKGAASAVDVHFCVLFALPDLHQGSTIRFIPCLCDQVGKPAVEVGCPHCMAEHLGMVCKFQPVLVVVGSSDHFIAQPDRKLCRIQVCLVSGKAIQVDESHIVGGTDGCPAVWVFSASSKRALRQRVSLSPNPEGIVRRWSLRGHKPQ